MAPPGLLYVAVIEGVFPVPRALRPTALQLLLAHPRTDINQMTPANETILHVAIRENLVDLALYLMERHDMILIIPNGDSYYETARLD